MTTQSPLVLSALDRDRIAEVDRLAQAGPRSVGALVGLLRSPSWAVRRAVVAALARQGDDAIEALTAVLSGRRDDESQLAAAVDALAASRGDAVTAMLRLIALDPPAPILCDAAQVLGRRKALEAVPALSALTRHADDNVAVAAIEALGRVDRGASTDALLAVIESKSFFRMFPAIDVLGRSGDPRALAPLIGLLGAPRYALEAARALGSTGEPEAAPALASLLRRANDSLTRVIALSLAALHARALERFGSAETVERSLRGGDDVLPIVQRVAQCVSGATPEEQGALCNLLAWMGDAAAASTLIGLLDVTPTAAAQALRALGRENDPQLLEALRDADSGRRAALLPLVTSRTRSAEALYPCLEDRDLSVRVLACNALARIGDVQAVPRLFALLEEPDPMLAQAAIGAIQSLGSETTERLALAAARSSRPHLRRSALRIIAYFGYPAGLELLADAVRGPDDRLRDAAIYGLALMEAPRALAVLVEVAAHDNPRARAAAMRALGQAVAAGDVRETLRRGLRDHDAWVRYYACQSLGKTGDVSAVGELLLLLRDPAGQVRVAAVEALARLDAPAALEALRGAAHAEEPDVQRAALLGLGARRSPDALPALLQAVRSADAATRLIALSAISPSPSAEAGAAIAAAASDPDPSVREAAIGFLAARTDEASTAALLRLLSSSLTGDRAVEALATPTPGRIPALSAALEGANADLASALVAALARMKRSDAFAAIIDALSAGNVFARRASAGALAALRLPQARAALEQAANLDPDPEVRRACRSGLDG